MRLSILYTIIFTIILIVFSANANAVHREQLHEESKKNEYQKLLDETIKEVQEFFKEVTDQDVKTPIKDIGDFPRDSGVVAFCLPRNRDFPSYIAINHNLLKTMLQDMFQVILHEYIHCEYGIGHIQINGSIMNDGGRPGMPKWQVKEQFKLFHKWYMDNYNLSKSENRTN